MSMRDFLKRFVAALGDAAKSELDRDKVRAGGHVDVTTVDFSTIDPTTVDPTTVDPVAHPHLGVSDRE